MKQQRTPKQNKTFTHQPDIENSRHVVKKIKTQQQRKANNAIDRALKRRDLRGIYDMDDYYH